MTNSEIRALIKRCQKSPAFFIRNFCKVEHPKAGILPFNIWGYQKRSLKLFLKHRFNIYRKVRQSGISTLSGAFALWYAMFYPNKKILVVSKRDKDAKDFLKKNMKLPYTHLPEFWHGLYGDPDKIGNEHEINFPNSSTVKSLTSSPSTMRSESASLNIIDEAAFMPHMEEMWSGAAPTLIHGGSCIVISTSNGAGGWYHDTYKMAEKGDGIFNPIYVPWWEMDWAIEYKDDLTGQRNRIAPTDNMRKCSVDEEEFWGPYWSPWLKEQYDILRSRGEAHLFRQEILAEFLGTGNTVLDATALRRVESQVSDDYGTISTVNYYHPVSNKSVVIDFDNELRIWKKPVLPEPDVIEGGRIIKPGASGHTYSMGVDIASSEANDFSAITIVNCFTKELVAELNIKVLPATLLMMVDYLGRWYNGAFVVPERTGIGIPFCQSLYNEIGYANVYHMKNPSGKRSRKIGFPTSPAHKPTLDKCLMDYLDDDGIIVYSGRCYEQLTKYINLGKNKTGAMGGAYDDLVIALGLALVGIREAVQADTTNMIPSKHKNDIEDPLLVRRNTNKMLELLSHGGVDAMIPIKPGQNVINLQDKNADIMNFAKQLGGIPMNQDFGIYRF